MDGGGLVTENGMPAGDFSNLSASIAALLANPSSLTLGSTPRMFGSGDVDTTPYTPQSAAYWATQGMNPYQAQYASEHGGSAPAPPGADFIKGLAGFVGLLAPMLAGPLGPLLGGALGTSAGVGSALVSGAGGALAGGANGGLEGALLGGALGGLGPVAGNAISKAVTPILGNLGNTITGGAGNLIGDAAGDTLGGALGGAVNTVAPLTVMAGGGQTLGGLLGGATGALGGAHFNPGPTGNLDFNTPLTGSDGSTVAPGGDPSGNFNPNLSFNPGPGGPLDFTGGATGAGGGNGDGVTDVDPVDVIASKPTGPVITGVPPFSTGGQTLTQFNPDNITPAGNGGDDNQSIKQFLDNMLNSTQGGGGSQLMNWLTGLTGGGVPGGVLFGEPPRGGGTPGTSTTLGGTMPSFTAPPRPGTGLRVQPARPISKGGTGGQAGVGVGGSNPLDIKGSLAPDIYPWSTGGL